jgi:dTDP-4-dehydrorhamnose 3,5-epimerase
MAEPTSIVQLLPLKHIKAEAGDIFHIMRNDSPSYKGFGEVYISTIKPGFIKGWKRHKEMTLNIVVPVGAIFFVLYDNRSSSFNNHQITEIRLSPENYCRLTIPPGIWMAFKCEGDKESMLINFADIVHNPSESDSLELTTKEIPYEWK